MDPNAISYAVAWTDDESRLLARLYNGQPIVVDDLPYTGEFEDIYRCFRRQTGKRVTRHHTFQHLIALRKVKKEKRIVGAELFKKGRTDIEPKYWD